VIARGNVFLLLLSFLSFSCRGGPAFFLRTSFAAPKAWSLVDEADRPVEVALEPADGHILFQAGVIRENWAEDAAGYTHADTVGILYGGRIHLWVFKPFLVYPLPPLPGIQRESRQTERVIWDRDTLTVEENQILTVREGPEIVLIRNLSLDGTGVFHEERRMVFANGDLTEFHLFRVIQGDTLHLMYRKP